MCQLNYVYMAGVNTDICVDGVTPKVAHKPESETGIKIWNPSLKVTSIEAFENSPGYLELEVTTIEADEVLGPIESTTLVTYSGEYYIEIVPEEEPEEGSGSGIE